MKKITTPRNAPWCWYIYLQNWVIFRANVGRYTIHGAYGTGIPVPIDFDNPILMSIFVSNPIRIFWDYVCFQSKKTQNNTTYSLVDRYPIDYGI